MEILKAVLREMEKFGAAKPNNVAEKILDYSRSFGVILARSKQDVKGV